MPFDYDAYSTKGLVIAQSDIECESDRFEAVMINQFGGVFIWTTKNVWIVTRTADAGCIEKLSYYPLDHRTLK